MNLPEEITPEYAERLIALLCMMSDLDRDGLGFLVGHMASKNIDLAIEGVRDTFVGVPRSAWL